jgi:hypothetical protein
MALTEQEEFELLSLEREKAMASSQQQPNLLQQLLGATENTVGTLAGGMIQPPVKIIGRAGQAIESMLSGQPPQSYEVPLPQYLGGNIPISPAQTMSQSMGPVLQTSAMMMGGSPALAGAMYGAGEGMEERNSGLEIAGKTALGGLIGAGVGVMTGQYNPKKLIRKQDWSKFAQDIRNRFVEAKQAATDKFGSQIERLAIENPEKSVDLSSIADDLNDNLMEYTQEFKNIVKKIPGFDFDRASGKFTLGKTTLGKSQEMINYIKTKIPKEIKYQHLDLLDLESSLKASQLEAFPEMEVVRQSYAQFIQPYNQVKAQFKFNRLLKAIEGDFGGDEGLNAVKQILPQDVIKQMGGYKRAVKSAKVGKEILKELLKWSSVAAGAGAAIGVGKKLID